jgi:Sulfite exporter TauE/SafE
MVMAFGAAAIRGLTGFGMAIILVPLLCLVMRPDAAVILAILLQFMIGPVGIAKIIQDADFKSAVPIMAAAIITTPFGLWLLAHTQPDVARVPVHIITANAPIDTKRHHNDLYRGVSRDFDRFCSNARAARRRFLCSGQYHADSGARIDDADILCHSDYRHRNRRALRAVNDADHNHCLRHADPDDRGKLAWC